jgi:hypothetical protein
VRADEKLTAFLELGGGYSGRGLSAAIVSRWPIRFFRCRDHKRRK